MLATDLDEQHERVARELQESLMIYLYKAGASKQTWLRNRISILLARDRNLWRLRLENLEKRIEEHDDSEFG